MQEGKADCRHIVDVRHIYMHTNEGGVSPYFHAPGLRSDLGQPPCLAPNKSHQIIHSQTATFPHPQVDSKLILGRFTYLVASVRYPGPPGSESLQPWWQKKLPCVGEDHNPDCAACLLAAAGQCHRLHPFRKRTCTISREVNIRPPTCLAGPPDLTLLLLTCCHRAGK
jgi:hypothetical protein